MFVWGACFGLTATLLTRRGAQMPFTSQPWKYASNMFLTGSVFYYFDWSRRLSLEGVCLNEEKLDVIKTRQRIDRLETGEELSAAFKVDTLGISLQTSQI